MKGPPKTRLNFDGELSQVLGIIRRLLLGTSESD